MKTLSLTLLGAAAAVALLAAPASAAIVCNADGDCWKVKEKYEYPPAAGLQIYGDDWVIDTNKYRWREAQPGPGYWRKGVWIGF